jgi:hypothetical protein
MGHRPHARRPMIQRHHIRFATAFVVVLMILALALYGYQFWWSE